VGVGLIAVLIELYLVVLFVRIMFTWFPIERGTPAARVERVLGAVTDPVLRQLRRLIPPVRVGGMALDLSPIILFFVATIAIRAL
jgi:YggT family protein